MVIGTAKLTTGILYYKSVWNALTKEKSAHKCIKFDSNKKKFDRKFFDMLKIYCPDF